MTDLAAQKLVLFDIDGTLTTKDTMFDFAAFAVGRTRLVLVMWLISPILVAMLAGLVCRAWTKSLLLRLTFWGKDQSVLEAAAQRYATAGFPPVLRSPGLARLRQHLSAGDRVLFVSASFDLWLKPWAADQGVELICTRTAWVDDRFAGIDGVNCHGPEKVRRVREVLDPDAFERVVAYGDSSGDTEMLAMADEPYFKPFRDDA